MSAGKRGRGIVALAAIAAVVAGIAIVAVLAINYAQETDIQDTAPGTFVGDEGPLEPTGGRAQPQRIPAGAAEILVTPDVAHGGSEATVSGTGFAPSSNIAILLNNSPLDTTPGTIVTDDEGSFSAAVRLPSAPGNYFIAASGEGERGATAEITIVPSQQETQP